MNQTHEEESKQNDETSGVGKFHGGFGSALLEECLDRVAQATNNPSAPCRSGADMGEQSSHMTNPSQVTSPNMEQNPPQHSTSAHDPLPEDAAQRPKKRERKEEDLTPNSEQEQVDVKKEPEENHPPIRSSDPMHNTIWLGRDPMHTPYQLDTSAGTSAAPWIWAMSELRSVQYNLEMLRSRVDRVEALCDMTELREGQKALLTRVSSVEKCVTMHQPK